MIKKVTYFSPHFPSPAPHMHISKEVRRMNFIVTVLQIPAANTLLQIETKLNNYLFLRINKTNSSSLSLEILASFTDMKPQKASGI